MTGERDLTDRASFDYWYLEKVRFSDTDMLGHVNNVAFAALFESGRVNFTRSGVITDLPPALLVVMRRMELDYRGELHWPAEVEIGSRLTRIGTTSFTVGSAIFDGPRCVATALTTLVVIDRETRRASPLPAVVREAMGRYL